MKSNNPFSRSSSIKQSFRASMIKRNDDIPALNSKMFLQETPSERSHEHSFQASFNQSSRIMHLPLSPDSAMADKRPTIKKLSSTSLNQFQQT